MITQKPTQHSPFGLQVKRGLRPLWKKEGGQSEDTMMQSVDNNVTARHVPSVVVCARHVRHVVVVGRQRGHCSASQGWKCQNVSFPTFFCGFKCGAM